MDPIKHFPKPFMTEKKNNIKQSLAERFWQNEHEM